MTRPTITRRALFASLAVLPFLGRRTEASAPVEVVNGQGETGFISGRGTITTLSNGWYVNQWQPPERTIRFYGPVYSTVPIVCRVDLGDTADLIEDDE